MAREVHAWHAGGSPPGGLRADAVRYRRRNEGLQRLHVLQQEAGADGHVGGPVAFDFVVVLLPLRLRRSVLPAEGKREAEHGHTRSRIAEQVTQLLRHQAPC
eukprot:181753-Pyramimonas_sp.AAC.2